MLAAIRPDDWNLPLLLHVLGAMILVGAMVTVVVALLLAWRRDLGDGFLRRLGFWVLLFVGIPAYFLMRVPAQWVASKENVDDADFAWIGIGYTIADLGLPLLVIATILAGLSVRSARKGGGGDTLARIANVLSIILVVAYIVAIWAMTTKPV